MQVFAERKENMSGVVGAIIDTLVEIAGGFGQVLAAVFQGISGIFVEPATTAGGEPTLSFVGTLLLISVGSSLLFWGFNFIKNLISKKAK